MAIKEIKQDYTRMRNYMNRQKRVTAQINEGLEVMRITRTAGYYGVNINHSVRIKNAQKTEYETYTAFELYITDKLHQDIKRVMENLATIKENETAIDNRTPDN